MNRKLQRSYSFPAIFSCGSFLKMHRTHAAIVLLILIPSALFCQQNQPVISDSERVSKLIDTADSLIRIQMPEAARPILHQAQELTDRYQVNLSYQKNLQFALAWADVFEPVRGSAIVRSLLTATPAGDHLRRCILKDKLARFINQTGEFREAEAMFRKNLAEAESHGLDSCRALAYWGLALSLGSMQRRDEQIGSALSMAMIARRNNYAELEGLAYYIAGYGYLQKKETGKALQNFEKSITIFDKENLLVRSLSARTMIAWVYYSAGDKKQAMRWYRKSLEPARKALQKTTFCNILGCIGTIHSETGKPDSAVYYYQLAIKAGKEARDYFNLSWIYYDQYKLYDSMGDYKSALASHVLHKQFSDSLEAQQFRRGLNRIRQSFAAEQELKEQELLQIKLRQQKLITWSIVGGMALLSIILTITILQIRTSGKRRLAEMKSRIDEITQRNLRQQMNPHFIFNTLNSIQFYLYQQDKMAVNEYLNKFSLLIRKTLDNSRQPAISLKEEIEMVRLYLELESLRFKDRLSWEIEVDEEIDLIEMKVPPMLIQPLVENAITHGLRHKPESGTVRVTFTMLEEVIECRVEDNGIGRQAALEIQSTAHPGHQSVGTSISETRLKLINELYGKNLSIRYNDLTAPDGKPTGTLVMISLPFNLKTC